MSFAFITPASLKPFSPEAVAAITMSGSYSVNQESEFDSSSNGSSEDETVISDTESEESDDEEDERFQAISPNRLKGFSTHNADPDRVLSSFTSTGQRSLISRNSRKQLSLQAALGSFRDKLSSPSYSSAGSSTFSPGSPFFSSPVQQPSPQISVFDTESYEAEDDEEEELISPLPSADGSRRSSIQTVQAEEEVESKAPVALPSLDQLASWRLRRQELTGQEKEEVKEDKPPRSPTSIAARGRGLTILSRRTD